MLLNHLLPNLLSALPIIATPTQSPSQIEKRDVVIIGGGSAGTYTAIRLKDAGKSVAVLEAQDRLGGHTETYVDPETGVTVDFGVVVWHNNTLVTNYLDRLNITYGPASFTTGGETINADFRTGQVLPAAPQADPTAALAQYAGVLSQWPFLTNGFYNITDPVPEDLLLPWGEFVAKYNLSSAAINTIAQFNQGMGDPLKQLAIYQIKVFGLPLLQALAAGLIQESNGNMAALYENALDVLGDDVFLKSLVWSVERTEECVRVTFLDRTGRLQVVEADKLVVAIPQKIEKLLFLDMDEREVDVFSKFNNTAYYTGLMRNSGIAGNTSVRNVGLDTHYNLPAIPGAYSYSATRIPGLQDIKYSTELTLPLDVIQERIKEDLARLREAGVVSTDPEDIEFVELTAHAPFACGVSAEEIRDRFYDKFNSLQGYRRTYYAGAALEAQDSSLIWQFIESNLAPLLTA